MKPRKQRLWNRGRRIPQIPGWEAPEESSAAGLGSDQAPRSGWAGTHKDSRDGETDAPHASDQIATVFL